MKNYQLPLKAFFTSPAAEVWDWLRWEKACEITSFITPKYPLKTLISVTVNT